MITRHHLTLALMSALILGTALFPSDLSGLAALAAGSCAGAVLPDIHTTRPKRFCWRSLTWYVTRFSARICAPLLCAACYRLLSLNLCPADKRLTHSVPGIILTGGLCAAFLALPAIFFPLFVPFGAGILLGLAHHLVDDACTRKGITPFFPFSERRIAGSIRPCDMADKRIGRYQLCHGSVAAALLLMGGISRTPVPFAFSFSALAGCCAVMVFFSEISYGEEPYGYRYPVPVHGTGT